MPFQGTSDFTTVVLRCAKRWPLTAGPTTSGNPYRARQYNSNICACVAQSEHCRWRG